MTLEAFKCPTCGSSDLEDTAWNTTKCQNCGTVSRVSDDRLRLETLVWACPKCGFNNEREVKFCAKCGHVLLHNCPYCSCETRAAAEFCEHCGISYAEGLLITGWINYVKGILPEYGVRPAMVARIAEGPFLEVFEACAEALRQTKTKDVSANPQAGEVIGVLWSDWVRAYKFSVRVLVERETTRHRGVAVVCTRGRRAIIPLFRKLTPGNADQIAEALWAKIKVLPPTTRYSP